MGALVITSNGTLFAGIGEANPGGGSITYGGSGVYRSVDGGATWQRFNGPIGSTYDVRFLTADFGHAVGNYGFAISRNGGVSWSYAPNSIHFVDFRNTSLGLGSSVNGLYRTTDGGLTFTRVRTESISNARFINDILLSAPSIVVGLFMAGWGSNNKYALLSAMRAVNQIISYDLPFIFAALVPVVLAGSLQGLFIAVGIALGYLRQRRTAKRMRRGQTLRGSELLSAAQFNRLKHGDAVALIATPTRTRPRYARAVSPLRGCRSVSQ